MTAAAVALAGLLIAAGLLLLALGRAIDRAVTFR